MSMLVLLSSPVFAGDFRLLDFGASCADVVAQETSLGAKAVKARVEGMGVLRFEGEAFDRQVEFWYFCPKGTLFAGDYLLSAEPPSKAVDTYAEIHKKLSSVFGAPWLDNSPWMQPSVDPRWLEKDPRFYSTTWSTSRAKVSTIFLPLPPEEGSGWRIAIHYGQASNAERSNTSFERTREK